MAALLLLPPLDPPAPHVKLSSVPGNQISYHSPHFSRIVQASSSFHPSGLTPGRSEWPRRMKGRKKPDQLVKTQNKTPGFVVQIPEGLDVNCHNNIQSHPLIAPKNQELSLDAIESFDHSFW